MVDPHNSCRRNEFKSRRGISFTPFQSALLKFGRGIWPLQIWVLVYAKQIHVVSSVPILLVRTRGSQSAALLTCPTASHALNLSLSMAPAASKAHPPGRPNVSAKAQGTPQEPRHTSNTHPAAAGTGSGRRRSRSPRLRMGRFGFDIMCFSFGAIRLINTLRSGAVEQEIPLC